MGAVPNIRRAQFPRQSTLQGKTVRVAFHYDTDHWQYGWLMRDDAEEPGLTILRLDDGRYVLATECQWSELT